MNTVPESQSTSSQQPAASYPYRWYGIRILIALLVTIYTLTNAGRFHIIDEASLFAVTEAVALRGALDTNAIAWTQWVNSPGEVLGAFGPDGQVFSKKGPAPALLALPWYTLLQFFARLDIQLGLLQGTLLWNGLVTACTAALLWLTAARLGYEDRTSVLLGLLYGLCTIAWPYAKHYFGEPLSAFSLLACFYGLLAYRQTSKVRWMWFAGTGAGIAIATVTAHAILVAVLAIYWLIRGQGASFDFAQDKRGKEQHAPRITLRPLLALLAFVLPIALCGVFLLWYNLVRFGDPFVTGYHFESGEGFTTPIGQGLWGLLISPYRGLFWHTPLFVGTLVGFAPFTRRHPPEGIVIAALSVVLIGLYSTWWMWWGGFAWGPRFLVPLAPFWVLVLAPLVKRLEIGYWRLPPTQSPITNLQSLRTSSILFVIVVLLSLVVQVLAVVVNYVNYEIALRSVFPTDERNPLAFGPPAQRLADWQYSPVLGQWKLAYDDLVANTDLAWLEASGTVHWVTLVVGIAAVLTLASALFGWWGNSGKTEGVTLPSRFIRWALPLLAVVVMAVWIGETTRDPIYGVPGQGYRAILAEICGQVQSGDALVTIAPYQYHIPMNWMGGLCGQVPPIFGYATDSMNHEETQRVLARLLQVYQRIWFVTDGLPANDPANTVERWLASTAYKADDRWFADYRLVRYATPLGLQGVQPNTLDIFLTDAQGRQVSIWSAHAPTTAAPGELMPVAITYQLETPVDANLRWFVQLLSPEGAAVALLDTAADQGYGAFPGLPVGAQFVERAALPLPVNLPPGRYRLIAGLYNPEASGQNRLMTPNGRDHVELGEVNVQ